MTTNTGNVIPGYRDHDPIRSVPESMVELDLRFMHGIIQDMRNQSDPYINVRGILDVSRADAGVPLIYPPGLGYINSIDQRDVLDHSRLPFISDTNVIQMYDFILGNNGDHGLVPKQVEIDLFRSDPGALATFYRDPSVIQKLRLADLLLDVKSTNMFGFWANLNDRSFQELFSILRKGQLPHSLTSDIEMTRLLNDRQAQVKFEYPEGEQIGTRNPDESRPLFQSARFRLLDLLLSHEVYAHDPNERVPTIGTPGGPPRYRFDYQVDIPMVLARLASEYPES